MPVTLNELARAAGVSVSTVSRALNSSAHPVNEETRKLILDLASQMDYRPNVAARGLKMDRTYTIGLVVYNIASPFTPILIRGIQEYLKQHDYFSIIISTDWDPDLEGEAVHQLISRSIDGVIFVETWRDGSNSPLDLANKPYVYVYRLFDGEYANSVNIDDRAGGALAVEHLVNLGHRRIGYINGPQGWASSRDRFLGYKDVLKQSGIELDPTLVEEGNWEVQSGYQAACRLMKLDDRPTAIFAANDLMALGAIYGIQKSGLTVPGDVAVVGYDDQDFAGFSNPTITTVRSPAFEMGKMAAKLILDRLENQKEILDPIKVAGSLVIRESSGSKQVDLPTEHYISHTLPPESLIRKWKGKNKHD
jgi:DNA-binding LacI/PurR family transcriptional regulator